MSAFEIRAATPDDADAIWPLTAAFAESFTPERAAFERAIENLLGRDDTFFAVALSGDQVVGYVLASTHHTLFANAPVVWVEELMVDEEARLGRIGRTLMDAVEVWAFALNAAYVSLATRRAADFYRAIGYEESATFFRKASR